MTDYLFYALCAIVVFELLAVFGWLIKRGE